MNIKKAQIILFQEYCSTNDREYAQNLVEAVADIPTLISNITRSHDIKSTIGYGILTLLLSLFPFFAIFLIWGGGNALLFMTLQTSLISFLTWKSKRAKIKTLDKFMLKKKILCPSPTLEEVEEALIFIWKIKERRGSKIPKSLSQMTHLIQNLDIQKPAQEYMRNLIHGDWEKRFEARHILNRYGTEILKGLFGMNKLRLPVYRKTRDRLVGNISENTATRFSQKPSDFVCIPCLTRFAKHTIHENTASISHYFGCRTCKQSRKYEFVPNGIVAILDNDIIEKYILHDGKMIVNWLLHRKIFDFDRVEIINATDKDVEQFCIQVGNDTDEIRHPKYKKMECIVKCELSENTMRILENTFGKVEKIDG